LLAEGKLQRSNIAINDRFSIESRFLISRSGDAYLGLDRSSNRPVFVWMGRHLLESGSVEANRFCERIERISNLKPSVCEVIGYGVDPSGTPFVVIPRFDGQTFLGGNLDATEAERRFLYAVRIIGRMHEDGLICGDLCADSFLLGRSGEIRYVSLLGELAPVISSDSNLVPPETLKFVAPEQLSGRISNPASDIFSLGLLGFYLFTHRMPILPRGDNWAGWQAPVPSSINKGINPVIDEIITKCLQPRPEARIESIAAIQRLLEDRTKASLDSLPVKRSAGFTSGSGSSSTVYEGSMKKEEVEEKISSAPSGLVTFLRKRSIYVIALIASLVTIILLLLVPKKDPALQEISQNLEAFEVAAGDSPLGKALGGLRQEDLAEAERQKQLDVLSASDDPLANEALIKSAKAAASDLQYRSQIELALVSRVKRLGLTRTAEQLRQWLRTIAGEGTLPLFYEVALRAVDKTLPQQAVEEALTQVYGGDPKLALRLASSLALDSGDVARFAPLLSKMMQDFNQNSDYKDRDPLALILSDPELSLRFGEDVIKLRDSIPSQDLVWLLGVLASREDAYIKPIAGLVMERGILTKLQSEFLRPVRERTNLRSDVMLLLLKCATGAVNKDDISVFGRWVDIEAEKLLLAYLATRPASDLADEAISTLAGKSLTIEPSASLVSWIRQNAWNERAKFSELVGLVGLSDVATVDQIESALVVIDPIVKQRGLLTSLLVGANPNVAKALIRRYGDRLGISALVTLLENNDLEVRRAAVKSLKGVNEVAFLKMVIDRYEKEKDPETRKVYEDTFWVIKQRANR